MRVGGREEKMKMRLMTMHHTQERSCQIIDLINKKEDEL